MSKLVVYCQNIHGPLAKDFQTTVWHVAMYLKKYHNAEIQEVHNEQWIQVGNLKTRVLDCEGLLYYPEEDIAKAISFSDTDTPLTNFFFARHNPNDILIMSQNGSTLLRFHDQHNPESIFKFKGTIYLPESPIFDLDHYWVRRQLLTEFRDTMVFRGNVHNMPRYSPQILEGNQYFEGPDYLAITEYFYSAIGCKVGLSVAGVGELCHRDVEYMAIGLPMLRFEYITKWNPELIPNYHYISIPRIDDEAAKEQVGGKEYVDLYLQRFLEVKDDKEFLEFISNNARKYYEDNIHPLKRLPGIINLFEL